MVGIACQHESRKKHGRDRKGNQRWRCLDCGATFTRNEERPLGDMRTTLDDACRVLAMLLEGMSIRACERILGIKRDTICDLVRHVGQNCEAFLEANVKGVQADYLELDEIWGFVYCKRRHLNLTMAGIDAGDNWTWLAIDAESKLICSHVCGQRTTTECAKFMRRLASATVGECQITSDGLGHYQHNVPRFMGHRCSFAQLVKNYRNVQTTTRYSPSVITGIEIIPRFGNPDPDHISTSYSERFNLSVRMHNRRFTRLTNAHSKSEPHHVAMMALFVAWYNFCRKHETLRKRTPAMAAGLTDHVWTLQELLRVAAG